MADGLIDLIRRFMASYLEDINTAQLGDVTAMARLGADAFGKGRVVEAVFWMVMADLRGFRNLDGVLRDYTAAWVQMGSPEQREMVGPHFGEAQREFGFVALLWFSNLDRLYARNWFSREAKAGNYDAREFTMRYLSRV